MVVLGGGAVSYERGTPVPWGVNGGRASVNKGRSHSELNQRIREGAYMTDVFVRDDGLSLLQLPTQRPYARATWVPRS